jgi:hypothetical protein
MESIVINVKTESDKSLFYTLAQRLHLKAKVLTDEDKEDYGLLKAMMEGKTGEYIDTERYLNKLRKK